MTNNNDGFKKEQLKQLFKEVVSKISDENFEVNDADKKHAIEFVNKFYKSIYNASSLNIEFSLEDILALIILEQSQQIVKLQEQSKELNKIKELNQILSKELKISLNI